MGEITKDNELLYAKIEALEGKRPSPTGGRDDKPSTLALLCSLLWSGARCTRVKISRASVYRFSKRRRRTRAPVDPVRSAHVRTRNWQIIPPANRCLPPSRRGLPQVMGAIALCWRSREPPPVRRVMRENGLLAPHRVGRTEAQLHDGTIITDKVNERGDRDMTQTITIREGPGAPSSSPWNTPTRKPSAFMHRGRLIASRPAAVRQGAHRVFGAMAPKHRCTP